MAIVSATDANDQQNPHFTTSFVFAYYGGAIIYCSKNTIDYCY